MAASQTLDPPVSRPFRMAPCSRARHGTTSSVALLAAVAAVTAVAAFVIGGLSIMPSSNLMPMLSSMPAADSTDIRRAAGFGSPIREYRTYRVNPDRLHAGPNLASQLDTTIDAQAFPVVTDQLMIAGSANILLAPSAIATRKADSRADSPCPTTGTDSLAGAATDPARFPTYRLC